MRLSSYANSRGNPTVTWSRTSKDVSSGTVRVRHLYISTCVWSNVHITLLTSSSSSSSTKEPQYQGLNKEKDWLELEKHSLSVLRSFLSDMAVADHRLIQLRTLEKTEKANQAVVEARRQALADAQAKHEAEQLAKEEAKRESEAEAKRKAALEEKERQEAQAATSRPRLRCSPCRPRSPPTRPSSRSSPPTWPRARSPAPSFPRRWPPPPNCSPDWLARLRSKKN